MAKYATVLSLTLTIVSICSTLYVMYSQYKSNVREASKHSLYMSNYAKSI